MGDENKRLSLMPINGENDGAARWVPALASLLRNLFMILALGVAFDEWGVVLF